MRKAIGIFRTALVAAAIFAVLALAANFGMHVRFTPRDLAFGQASSYTLLPYAYGAPVNGKPSVIPSTYTADTETSVASGSLTNSPVYDVTALNERARMINVGFGVTVVPSSGPSMTPVVQQSDDGGQNWYKVYAQDGSTFAAITSTGTVTGKDFPVYGDIFRVAYTSAAGTGANWTFTVNVKQAQ